jgi:chemotaxis protein methyltransferase CheR
MSVHDDNLSSRDFTRFCGLIHTQARICLSTEKKTMVEVRLKRRLRALGMTSYTDYCDYVFGGEGMKELVPMIDVITTNKTDFFREAGHFDYLVQKALPERTSETAGRPVLVWSAGCSTGEEPYTLAMVLSEYGQSHPGFQFRVMATDISTQVLAKAIECRLCGIHCRPIPHHSSLPSATWRRVRTGDAKAYLGRRQGLLFRPKREA